MRGQSAAVPNLREQVLTWYADHARDLPWRRPEASPWAVLVSEIMLQQTPVNRVLPVWEAWLDRWPTAADLARAAPGEAVRAWGRLGYPRRALRLHAAATAIVERFGGEVPSSPAELLSLPGVGDYTAAAVSAFAHQFAEGDRHAVLDTNVRRVLARLLDGNEFPPNNQSVAEKRRATALLPADNAEAATWSVAVMELGALVCTASSPTCADCPVRESCHWRALGFPAYDGPPRRGQAWHGTDRQCRGRLLAVLRDSHAPVPKERLDVVWNDDDQRAKCLASLVVDGLAIEPEPGFFCLP